MKISPQAKRVHLPEVVGKGYGTFWNFKGRYRVCKGSRASKKSKTTALNIIKRMMQYPEANTLVVRKVFRTLKDSCFTELKWAINRLGVAAYWEIKESPLEMTYIPTGQKIYFRGLDDSLVKLFLSPDVKVPAGCKIIVTRPNDVERTFTYSRSGEPGVFSNHQEIMLEPFRGWA